MLILSIIIFFLAALIYVTENMMIMDGRMAAKTMSRWMPIWINLNSSWPNTGADYASRMRVNQLVCHEIKQQNTLLGEHAMRVAKWRKKHDVYVSHELQPLFTRKIDISFRPEDRKINTVADNRFTVSIWKWHFDGYRTHFILIL